MRYPLGAFRDVFLNCGHVFRGVVMKSLRLWAVLVLVLMSAVGCGGDSNGPDFNASYTVGGTLSGLRAGSTVTLLSTTATQSSWTKTMVAENGSFTLEMPVKYNGSYAVTIGTQPAGQTCSVVNGSGAGVVSNVAKVSVICSDFPFRIEGSVTGLGAGKSVTLLNNAGDSTIVSSNGSFQFAIPVAQNASYAVTVASQPIGQVCTVNAGSGAGVVADIKNVSVVCSDLSYKVSGSLSGLRSGEQVTLFNNLGDALTLSANGAFSFAMPLAFNGSYAVTVATQPKGQTCTVSGGAGTGVIAPVGNVSVTCSDFVYRISGSVSGLAADKQVTLLNNGSDAAIISSNGTFQFATPIAYNGSFAITVGTQPRGQTCSVIRGNGNGVVADVNNVSVVCSTASYSIAGSISGLAPGKQVSVLNNGASPITLTTNGNFRFPSPIAFDGAYAVTVGTQPAGQTCSVVNGSGAGVTADVLNLSIVCSDITYRISGTLTGLSSGRQITLTNNSESTITLTSNGAFSFPAPVALNGSYSVSVNTQPPGQTCTVNSASGSGVTANVTSVAVVCSEVRYSVSGTVAGLNAGNRVTLFNNAGDALTVSANGGFSFPTPLAFNGSYAVTVATQPTGQTCSVNSGTGAGISANITTVAVLCSNLTYTIAGTVAGLGTGKQVTVFNNAGNATSVTASGGFSFSTPVAYGASYAVTVGTQPTGQTCTVNSGAGANVTANVATVAIVCSDTTYTIGGTISGLGAGKQVTFFNNGANPLTALANGSFVFPTRVAFSGNYAVTVSTQPVGQICTVYNGTGSNIAGNITGVSVVCTDSIFTIAGSLTGLSAGNFVTLLNGGADPLTLTSNQSFRFSLPVSYNGTYAVTVGTQPATQTCFVSNGTGTAVTSNISTVSVSCYNGTGLTGVGGAGG